MHTEVHSLCGRGHQAFVTEAVPFVSYSRFGLTLSAYSRLDFASPPYISSSLGVARPFTNKVGLARRHTALAIR